MKWGRLSLMVGLLACSAGCVLDTHQGQLAAPVSILRPQFRDEFAKELEKKLKTEDWTGSILARTDLGSVSTNPGEIWSEDKITIDLESKDKEGEPIRIPIQDYAGVLKGLRTKLRDWVEAQGGTQVDWSINESYRERTLVFIYTLGTTTGGILVRIFPKRDDPDELNTRLIFTVREQPTPGG